ncbi:ras GTPase-activating protein-binding protein 2 isoform X2 [Bemisia tabaci]|uniref:ras GTPase-activating protein-binding protein 2 isoform X2 n=1 Tax=Bemisia tabaci TaxID=7038 RepID=UPI0008F990D9|nr:PREDICTED: ras GTPase-activating protein-binding protein 2 isoform X2 [Bemisia tabaci]
MVMEAQPSPQCVGREFVRQYYTLLNEAPTHLHRFYNNQSSFVHGGMEMLNGNRETKPVIGQRQIHQRIQQLNFQDCHAKISQVDSQATLGNGVVVQVTGELSNNGQPMRRFTQTFVLAAQSPKKYYVHNDIFRYQDMLMSDEEGEGDSGRSEAEEEMEAENQPVPEMQPDDGVQPQSVYYSAGSQVMNGGPVTQSATPMIEEPRLPTAPPASAVPNYNMDLIHVHSSPAVSPVQQQQIPLQQTQLSHGVEAYGGEAEEMNVEMAHETAEEPEQEEELAEPAPAQEEYKEETAVSPVAAQPHQPSTDNAASNKPRSYANLLKAGSTAGSFSSPAPVTPAAKAPLSPPIANVFPTPRNDTGGVGSGPQRGGMGAPRGARGGVRGGLGGSRLGDRTSSNFERSQPRLSVSEETGGNYTSPGPDADRNRRGQSGSSGGSPQYSDKQQLFMGSIPPNLTDDDIRNVFSKFGVISELRIKRNGPGKHFGFITFEEVHSAQAVLQARPITLPDSNIKLNIEEKKQRSGGRGLDGPTDRSDRDRERDREQRIERSERERSDRERNGATGGSGAGGRGDGGRPVRGDGGPRGGLRGAPPHRGGRGGFMRGEGRPSGGPVRGGAATPSSFKR